MFAIVGGCSGGSGAGGTAASNKSSLSGGNPEKASNLVVSVAYRMGDSYRSPDKDLKCEPAEASFRKKLLQVVGQKCASRPQAAKKQLAISS